jgi:DNA-binding MarR family transcriptional regulator
MASWAVSRPDLDVTPVAVTTRLARIRDHLEGEMAAVLGAYGLTAPTFMILATLARLGGSVDDAQLGEELGLTPGTVDVRIERLVSDGLVNDEGGTIALTDRARGLVDEAVPAHLENQARLLESLTPDEQAQLADLLRKLLVALEG